MQPEIHSRRPTSQQLFATATAFVLLLVGVLPALHQHEDVAPVEAHCHDSGLQAATHLETLELEHHEPCGLCAKSFSSARLQRPLTTLVDELVAEHGSEGPEILPPGAPGRHGASRAPPIA